MAELPISGVSQAERIGDAWVSIVIVADEFEEAEFRVEISDTQRCISGLREPTTAWIVERLGVCGPLLDNYRPVLEQVREWRQPVQLFADPR